ncbi:MAG: ATP-binding protein [Phycisphaerae bacterium]|nr:ATP-binding protein [Phycisphaerae bacterium]
MIADTPIDKSVLLVIALGAVVFITLVLALSMRRAELVARAPSIELDSGTPAGLRSIAETANLIVGRIDASGRFQWISPNVQSILGVSSQDLVSGRRSFHEFVHEDDRPSLAAAGGRRRQGGRDRVEFQYRLRVPDGTWRWFHERQGPVQSSGGVPVLWEIVAVDLTDRRRAGEQQRQALALQQLSTRVLESFLQIEDLDTTIGEALNVVGEFFGVARASYFLVEGQQEGVRLVSEWVAPGVPSAMDRRRNVPMDVARWWARALAGGAPLIVVRDDDSHSRPDLVARLNPEVQSILCIPIITGGGTAGPGETSRGGLRAAILVEDLEKPRRWKTEEIATLQTLGFAVARGLEQRDSVDAATRFMALQRKLERSELVTQLTSGIAHDFNNILFAISGHVELLRQRTMDDVTRASLVDIEGVISGANGFVSGILHAHRGEFESPAPTALADELEAATNLAVRLMPRGVQVETDLGAAHSCVARSTAQGLRQLILNLVVNARDAVKGRGVIRLSCRVEDCADLGLCAVIVVEDSGPGIPPELHDRVLQPFFTTKGKAGTGLGLSICQRVVQESGGRLRLGQSPALGGLRVSASLPLCTDDADIARARPVVSASIVNVDIGDERLPEIGHLLLVEDDPAVRDVLTAAFTSLDIDVIARGDARDVCAIVIEGPLPIDLLVMDIDLPEITGVQCLAQLRAQGCMLPCLFVTGGLTEVDGSLAPCRVLRKPFRLDALMGACRAVLDDAPRIPQA